MTVAAMGSQMILTFCVLTAVAGDQSQSRLDRAFSANRFVFDGEPIISASSESLSVYKIGSPLSLSLRGWEGPSDDPAGHARAWGSATIAPHGELDEILGSGWPVGDQCARRRPDNILIYAAKSSGMNSESAFGRYGRFVVWAHGRVKAEKASRPIDQPVEGLLRQALSNLMEDDCLDAEDRSFMGWEMDVRIGPRGGEVVPLEDWAAVAGATVAHDPVVQSWTLTKGEQVWEFRLAADCLEVGGRRTAMGGFLVRIGGRPYAPIAALAAHVR